MRLLLLGGQGRVGWELQRALVPLGEVVSPARAVVDLTDADALQAAVARTAPDVIVNAAAFTAVDLAEAQPEAAWVVNATAPGLLAAAAARTGAWLVHYSTDQVFDGRAPGPYAEDAAAAPLNAYGRSKWAGETQIRASGCRHLILRTTWVHAARGSSFAHLMLRLAVERAQIDVVHDEIGAPTPASLVADTTAHVLRSCLQQPGLAGTYHCVASGQTSRFAYARYLLDQARARGWPLQLAADGLRPVASAKFPAPAARPLNAVLDNRLLQARFGLHLPGWESGVLRLLDQLEPPR